MQGSVIPVVLDLTANHQGWFTFKICPNNDIWYQSLSIRTPVPTIQSHPIHLSISTCNNAGRTRNSLALTCSLSLWVRIGLLGIQSPTTGLVFDSSMSICLGGRALSRNSKFPRLCCYLIIFGYFIIFGCKLLMLFLKRFLRLSCSQCILQWTYTAGNNWGVCTNGTGELGCGPQETFR